jgi:hypothetical protein
MKTTDGLSFLGLLGFGGFVALAAGGLRVS